MLRRFFGPRGGTRPRGQLPLRAELGLCFVLCSVVVVFWVGWGLRKPTRKTVHTYCVLWGGVGLKRTPKVGVEGTYPNSPYPSFHEHGTRALGVILLKRPWQVI